LVLLVMIDLMIHFEAAVAAIPIGIEEAIITSLAAMTFALFTPFDICSEPTSAQPFISKRADNHIKGIRGRFNQKFDSLVQKIKAKYNTPPTGTPAPAKA
jgi:hypothetical protein